MTRVTLDANILAPGFTGRGSASAQLIDRWRAKRFDLVVSEHVLAELARTLTDPYFARRVPPEEHAAILQLVRTEAILTELTLVVQHVATHPEDDAVLATALSGHSSILCTRDKQLLRLRTYQTVTIMSPGELLDVLAEEDAG